MKGILFKPEGIKAIVEGRKTVTRRVIKPQPDKGLSIACYTVNDKPVDWVLADEDGDPIDASCPKPRYQVGEVYIKEAWSYHGCSNEMPADISTAHIRYLSDNTRRDITFPSFDKMMASVPQQNIPQKYPSNYHDLDEYEQITIHEELLHKWWQRVHKGISPLFMPEWAARYFIKITDIRAERLQEIRTEDIMAEGLESTIPYQGFVHRFKRLWDSINPKYPWESNPWVFVYSFKKAEK